MQSMDRALDFWEHLMSFVKIVLSLLRYFWRQNSVEFPFYSDILMQVHIFLEGISVLGRCLLSLNKDLLNSYFILQTIFIQQNNGISYTLVWQTSYNEIKTQIAHHVSMLESKKDCRRLYYIMTLAKDTKSEQIIS